MKEREGKVKREKNEEVNGQGGKEGCPGPTRNDRSLLCATRLSVLLPHHKDIKEVL